MRVFNNWKRTHSCTEETHIYEPEDFGDHLGEAFYAELRKTNGTD